MLSWLGLQDGIILWFNSVRQRIFDPVGEKNVELGYSEIFNMLVKD